MEYLKIAGLITSILALTFVVVGLFSPPKSRTKALAYGMSSLFWLVTFFIMLVFKEWLTATLCFIWTIWDGYDFKKHAKLYIESLE